MADRASEREEVRERCRRTRWSKSRRCCMSGGTRFITCSGPAKLRSLKIGKLRRITEQQLAEFIASLDHAGMS